MSKIKFVQQVLLVVGISLGLLYTVGEAAPRDVQFKTVDFESLVIEVHNFGDTSQPFTNWRFCSHDDSEVRRYSTPGVLNSINLGAGESIFLHFNNDAPGGSSNALNISGLGNLAFATPLDRDAYSINLYVNSSFGSSTSMVDHIQWSLDGVDNFLADERSLVAQHANLWTNEAEWISTTPTTQRIELNLDGMGDPPAGTHGPASYSVIEPPPPSPADLNGDTNVDGDDLAIWSAAFGDNNGGDIDDDGDTDPADFLIWQRELTVSSPASITAVPEPGSVVLLTIGCLAFSMRKKIS